MVHFNGYWDSLVFFILFFGLAGYFFLPNFFSSTSCRVGLPISCSS